MCLSARPCQVEGYVSGQTNLSLLAKHNTFKFLMRWPFMEIRGNVDENLGGDVFFSFFSKFNAQE